MPSRSRTGPAARGVRLLTLAMILAILVPAPLQAQEAGTPPPLAGESDTELPCFDGRLRIRDLANADPSIPEGLERVYAVGADWEADAELFALRLGCPLLETGYQWEGTFFSRSAQAFFSTDTMEVRATNDDPASVPILSTKEGIEVQFVYVSLLRGGFEEDSLLGAGGGVTIRPSTDAQPFGPPSAPKGDVYFHVSIQQRGEVVDVWVASMDGTIYQYGTD